MVRNYRMRLKFLNLSSRTVIFVLGVTVGFILSFIVNKIPKGFVTSEKTSELTVEEPEFNPFAQFNIPLNERIDAKIRFHLTPGRKADLIESYKRSGRYLPMIKAIFEEYNLPQVLVFLPIVESGFAPYKRSRAGAVGLWQIMPSTASDYGLKYTRWIDERRDPEKSTLVAAEYLQFLYDKFGDWDLALAAYNSGYPKIRRATRREKSSNFWGLRRIPRETYNFVPNFYAILHILANPDKYGVKLPEKDEPLDYETIDIEATFSIEQIARLANVSPEVIRAFNPALTGNIAPSGKYSVKVPSGVKEHFLKQYKENPPDRVEITYTTYRVRKGDTLYEIAKKFGTTVNAIKADNNLRSTRWINVGMPLRIASITVSEQSVPATIIDETDTGADDLAETSDSSRIKLVYTVRRDGLSVNTLARYYSVTVDELKSWNPWLRSEKLQKGQEVDVHKSIDNISIHKIRRGDSLWRLARRYHTSVGNLKRWNQLRGSKIYPGQSLIVELRR